MAQTKRQKEIVDQFVSTRFERMKLLLDEMWEANNAIVPLPYTNEEGQPVVHRDNMQMHTLMDMLLMQAQAIYKHLSPEEEFQINQLFPHWHLFFKAPPRLNGERP